MHLAAILLNGLRDYGTAQWDGGDAECDHRGAPLASAASTLAGYTSESVKVRTHTMPVGQQCHCGARRIDRQLGLEATPDEYIATMVAVFRQLRRVLRDDGTCWVNMGDSYSGGGNQRSGEGETRALSEPLFHGGSAHLQQRRTTGDCSGLAAKQLLGMPWRLAFALQADGWWLRSAIVWAKPNPMPESCKDRPTSSYEHIFLLAKSSRYFYDSVGLAEAEADETLHDSARSYADRQHVNSARMGDNQSSRGQQMSLLPEDNGAADDGSCNPAEHGRGTHRIEHRSGLSIVQQSEGQPHHQPALKNSRNVWTIATSPYSAAHFATFPPELAERCIRAGTSERGCCAACGAPWVRETEREVIPLQATNNERSCDQNRRGAMPRVDVSSITTGWSASCRCEAGVVPAVVCDPFSGAGTTLLVADRLRRDAVGIELNASYAAMARERIVGDAPLLAEVAD